MPSLLLSSQAEAKATHADYHYINSAFCGTDGSVFALYDYEVGFYQAKQICEDLGGHLATIMSDEEETAVVNMINAVSTTRKGFYIGVHDSKANGHFEYIDGKELSEYLDGNGQHNPPWGSGEPNNLTTETAGEIYMETKKWNNASVTAANRGFICEFEASNKPIAQIRYNDNDYLLFNNSLSWTDAENACEQMGGHLVTISNRDENTAVTELARDNLHPHYWIGLHRNQSNHWAWVTGETISETGYENWATDEPSESTDNQFGFENVAHIVTNHPKSKKTEGTWNDQFDHYEDPASVYEICKFGYICEFEKKTLVFNANGGIFGSGNNVNEITKELHYNELLKITTPKRTGYSFQGWYDNRTGGTQYSFYNGDYKNVASGTYYAHWKGNEYTVKFNQRGVKNTAELGSIKVEYGRTYPALPIPEPKDTSKEFVCWTDSDGNEIRSSSIVNKSADHFLYPRWKDKASVTIKSIVVNTLPVKVDYLVGEKFDPSGLTLKAVFDDLSEAVIGFENCTFEDTDLVSSGRQTVKVAYQGLVTEFDINVYKIDSVFVGTLPTKTVYEIGESLDLTGLSLLLQYDNATQEFVCSGFQVENDNRTFAKSGKYYITVSYKGFDTQFEVYVNKAKYESVEIKTADGYSVYQNDNIDYSKIELCVTLTDGTRLSLNPQETITTVSFDSSVIGTHVANVVFTYDGESHSADLTVDVVEKPENLEPARIYSVSSINCTAEDLIRVPIYVDCETPLSGIGVVVDFDSEVLTPKTIEYESEFMSMASVVDSLDGNISDHVRIIALTDYQNGDSFTYTGRICTVSFKAKENKTVETEIEISIRENDTFGFDNKPVPFISSMVNVNIEQIAGFQDDHLNSIYALDQVQGSNNQLLNVPVYVNSSNLSGCRMTISYDNHLIQPVEVERSVLLENFTFDYNIKHDEGKVLITFFGSDKITAAGVLFNIVFNTENLKTSSTSIIIEINEAVNDVNKNVLLTGGSSTILKACSGDADEDGSITLQDVVLITRWLAGGWNVTINETNSDVNRDGEINLKDVVLIRRFLAGGWGVVLQ